MMGGGGVGCGAGTGVGTGLRGEDRPKAGAAGQGQAVAPQEGPVEPYLRCLPQPRAGPGGRQTVGLCLVSRLSLPLHSPACPQAVPPPAQAGTGASTLRVMLPTVPGTYTDLRIAKGCCFVTLFVEPTLDCCRTAVPVVFLLALTNHGVGLE